MSGHEKPSVVVVCGSRKPAPGVERPSAAREFLKPVLAGIADAGAEAVPFDLREMDIPYFDGRPPQDYECADLDRLTAALRSCAAVVFSVPAYWSAPSGPVTNLLNVLGGAAYDRPADLPRPYAGLRAVQLVVGADPASGYLGAAVFRGSLSALGFQVSPREIVVGDPRAVTDARALVARLRALGVHAAGGADDTVRAAQEPAVAGGARV